MKIEKKYRIVPHLVSIFQYLNPFTLSIASLVCHTWYKITCQNEIWQMLCCSLLQLSNPNTLQLDSILLIYDDSLINGWKIVYRYAIGIMHDILNMLERVQFIDNSWEYIDQMYTERK